MWKFEQARREAAEADQEAPQADARAPQPAGKPAAPLYSPVNSQIAAGADADGAPAKRDADQAPSNTAGQDAGPPLQRAA